MQAWSCLPESWGRMRNWGKPWWVNSWSSRKLRSLLSSCSWVASLHNEFSRKVNFWYFHEKSSRLLSLATMWTLWSFLSFSTKRDQIETSSKKSLLVRTFLLKLHALPSWNHSENYSLTFHFNRGTSIVACSRDVWLDCNNISRSWCSVLRRMDVSEILLFFREWLLELIFIHPWQWGWFTKDSSCHCWWRNNWSIFKTWKRGENICWFYSK